MIQPSSDAHILNSHPKLNGQSLIYIACKEGKYNIVKFLHDLGFKFRKVNFLGKSRICESCLEVVIRHNYTSLLDLILESKEYTYPEICDVVKAKLSTTSGIMSTVIYRHLSKGSCKYKVKYLWNNLTSLFNRK